MGLFSSKTRTYVSSSVWNLAGDAEERTDFLPSVVISSVLHRKSASVAEDIQRSLMSTTATRTRGFFRWAGENYDLGLPVGQIGTAYALTAKDVHQPLKTALNIKSNQRLQILSSVIDGPNVDYWAEAWVARNHKDKLDDDWDADLDVNTGELVVTIGSNTYRSSAPADLLWGRYAPNRHLLFVSYRIKNRMPSGIWRSSEDRLFTYRLGNGNAAFDGLYPRDPADAAEFYPALPLRIDNVSVTEKAYSDNVFAAFKKLTGTKMDDVLAQIEDHENLDDMDHVMVVPGISLNTKEAAGKAYIFKFMQFLADRQNESLTLNTEHLENLDRFKSTAAWERWEDGNEKAYSQTHPFFGSILEKAAPLLTTRSLNEIEVRMPQLPEYRMTLRWQAISETVHAGNAARFDGMSRPLLKKNGYWTHVIPPRSYDVSSLENSLSKLISLARGQYTFCVFHQFEKHRYRMIRVVGLEHLNYVYQDKAVTITAYDAMEDDEESGFLLPLHNPTMRSLGPLNNAQLSSSSLYLLINSYQRVKQKWYQRGIFKVLFVVAAIAISIISAGAALPTTVGILGQNAAVGLAVGASAATAALVGAVVNGIAAAIVTTVIANVSTTVFGEKWGAIVATIATFIAFQAGTQFAQTGSFEVDWGTMFRADNLMKLTDSVGNAYSQMIAADTADIYADIEKLTEGYEDQIEEIQKLSRDVLGMTNVSIDPMLFTDASEQFGESREAFISRTLMTGSDIADISLSMIESFAELSLELPGAL